VDVVLGMQRKQKSFFDYYADYVPFSSYSMFDAVRIRVKCVFAKNKSFNMLAKQKGRSPIFTPID
jgi:hypothetical protein